MQAVNGFLLLAMKVDYEQTKQCNLELGKCSYAELPLSWAVQKKSPYTDRLNKGYI